MKTLHFKNKENFIKWNAYGHMRTKQGLSVNAKVGRKSVFESTSGNTKVFIKNKLHRVKHR